MNSQLTPPTPAELAQVALRTIDTFERRLLADLDTFAGELWLRDRGNDHDVSIILFDALRAWRLRRDWEKA